MRLLRYSEDGEFSLTEDYIDNVPPYAILSHRWGKDSEEVAFRDIKDRTGKSKIGYEKIRFCARQAACDNLAFFWVDTCCIDKSSSFELQEAINSMFDWYKKADKCYVYLRDVSLRELQASEQVSEYSWEHYFRRSEWFTRGWTLQELLAPGPESMEFFSREGERLGTKKDLEQEIHDITEIPLAALRGTALSQFDVEQRLSWAKGRQTTRGEDKAYSLFGIFDVQLPFLPGEGEEKALKRLQKEIDKPLKKELAQKKRVMSWLSNTPYEKHHRHNSKSRSEGSGEWLLQTTKFKNWKTRPESDILWLRGLRMS
ncbi:heterokaryon incompatibility protein-domain-containing protein [Tricladium varicosporioides]|nr:heterokaryon incompatibility protein-domain-containing protein [Hymenoscyphus varicosporioides]